MNIFKVTDVKFPLREAIVWASWDILLTFPKHESSHSCFFACFGNLETGHVGKCKLDNLVLPFLESGDYGGRCLVMF